MVKLLGQKRLEKKGYTYAIDYWSLGVTVFKMFSGRRPFDKQEQKKLLEKSFSGGVGVLASAKRSGEDLDTQEAEQEMMIEAKKIDSELNKEYRDLMRKIEYPEYFTKETNELLNGLLECDESKRLGANGTGKLWVLGLLFCFSFRVLSVIDVPINAIVSFVQCSESPTSNYCVMRKIFRLISRTAC